MIDEIFTKVPYLFEFQGVEYSIEQLEQMAISSKEPLEAMKQNVDDYAISTEKFCGSFDRSQYNCGYNKLCPRDPNVYNNLEQCYGMRRSLEDLQNKYSKAGNYASDLQKAVDKAKLTRELAIEERKREIIEYKEIASTFDIIDEKPVESSISIASSLIPLGIIALIGLRGKK